jgi:hypothetical protein
MIVKQVSVFLENISGRLNEVTKILGEANINISAFTIADTSDFGILRLIVSDPENARAILKQNSFSVQITDVVLAKSPNLPGGLAKMLDILKTEDVFIEYMYAFSMNDKSATIILRPSDVPKCAEVLQRHSGELYITDEHYQL